MSHATPFDAAALFIGGKRENEVAIRLEFFLLQANKSGDQKRVAVLDISSAAAVKVSVLLNELERIHGPIRAARFDHIQMADEQQRLFRARAVNARHHVAFAVVRSQDLDIARRKTGIKQALGHRLRGNRGVANGIGGVDFNQLLENVARKLLGAVVHLSA